MYMSWAFIKIALIIKFNFYFFNLKNKIFKNKIKNVKNILFLVFLNIIY